jgi:hypothetical protein
MPDYSPYRYLTHIMSHNHWHSMRIGEAIGCRKSLKLSIIHGLDISLLVSSQLLPKTLNQRDMPESSPRRYPAHIVSHNHWHTMCIGEAIGSRESLKITFIHTVSTFHYLYPLNFRQRPSIIEICRNQVHAGTPHILRLTTTGITCVLVKQ